MTVADATGPGHRRLRLLFRPVLVAALGLGLSACGDPSKQEILKKAEGLSTRSELEAALGRPDDIGKMGPIERWTYDASDGSVVFVITGDNVALQMTGGRAR